jgi:hypothetical protein
MAFDFNLMKYYPELLDLNLGEVERTNSLRGIFDRDITNNDKFYYNGCRIYPIKSDGKFDLDREFTHLTTEEVEVSDEKGNITKRRVYDPYRSERLHWIKRHVEQNINDGEILVFSVKERNLQKRTDVIRTYIYNKMRKYVIVLEPQTRSNNRAYYLLTAYYLNRTYGEKQIKKKLKAKLSDVV